MTTPITPSGTPRQPETIKVSPRVDLGPLLKLIRSWILNERDRLAQLVEQRAWIVRKDEQVDIEASIAVLAKQIRDRSKDPTIFETPRAKT